LKQITGYLSPPDSQDLLRKELKNIIREYDRLILAEGPPQTVYWAQNVWLDPQIIQFTSISDAAKKLKDLQKLWSFYPYKNIRRGALISEKLPYFSPKPLNFPCSLPSTPLGSWTLIDPNTLIASPHCSSMFAQGEVHFHESKIPPSRAYLKLWEALTRIGVFPKPGEVCLEVGASPGSWTWVLQQFGSTVIAVDRAPLDPSISSLPNVNFMKKDAFSLKPTDFSRLDWIFSDVICYPEKLLSWIKQWLDINAKINFVCTLKFQGEINDQVIRDFAAIEGSQIVHLFHNKHELTWLNIYVK
jgi:23S rRNA (cytidine2498-2'-O)-methyltransferase